ncbi:MAG: FKBP-type peptidyl-prolyl cis-trans isomerase [Planctomycetes bacterium]|nr:FKBP-type peptidyl-prolyl cis-trans isomerase [Planctomycetota bacterium]
MKRIAMAIAALGLSLSLIALADDAKKTGQDELKTPGEKLSYAFGMEIGAFLKKLPEQMDLTMFCRGVKDTYEKKQTLLTPEQAVEVRKAAMLKMRAQRAQEAGALAKKNLAAEQAFLAENKKKDGVSTTESGLQYKVVRPAAGPKPKETDAVKVQYRGTLLDGTEFDSSYKRGRPAVFTVGKLIRGWKEGLQLMNVGSKVRLFVPSKLAYGPQGRGPTIGPNTMLIFDVELLGIEPAAK